MRISALALLLFTTLWLSTCGLEVVSYYGDPGFASAGSNAFTLTHNTANSDYFLGYDVYYRAYQTSTLADTARVTIESAISSSSSTPESVISQMTSAGFVKMYLASSPLSPPTPLCSVSSSYLSTAVKFNFTMDSSTANWYYTNSTDSGSTKVYVVRGLGTSTNNSFSYKYVSGDADYTLSNNAVTSGQTVYLVFFAVAYGYNISSLTSIYSVPTSLYTTMSYTLP